MGPRELEPLPPGGLTLRPCIAFGEVAEGQEVPDPHQTNVGVARLHRMAANRRQCVTGHRLDQFAAPGREPPSLRPRHEPAVILQPKHRKQLPGKLHGVGVAHALVAKPPAEVAAISIGGFDHLHRPRQRERLLHRLGIPAPPRRLDGKPKHAADADRGISRADNLRLRLQFSGPRNRPLLAAHADVPKPRRTAVVLQGNEPRKRLATNRRHLELINVVDQPLVEGDADARANHCHLQRVPFAGGPKSVLPGGDVAVDRPAGVRRGRSCRIVEELKLVAADRRPGRLGAAFVKRDGPQPDAGVAGAAACGLLQLEVEPQRDVGKRLRGVAQKPEALAVAHDLAVADRPHGPAVRMLLGVGVRLDDPAFEIMAVEQVCKLPVAGGRRCGQAGHWPRSKGEGRHEPHTIPP